MHSLFPTVRFPIIQRAIREEREDVETCRVVRDRDQDVGGGVEGHECVYGFLGEGRVDVECAGPGSDFVEWGLWEGVVG